MDVEGRKLKAQTIVAGIGAVLLLLLQRWLEHMGWDRAFPYVTFGFGLVTAWLVIALVGHWRDRPHWLDFLIPSTAIHTPPPAASTTSPLVAIGEELLQWRPQDHDLAFHAKLVDWLNQLHESARRHNSEVAEEIIALVASLGGRSTTSTATAQPIILKALTAARLLASRG